MSEPKEMRTHAAGALLFVLTLLDQAGLAEYGATWWIVKPIVTGAPCPECPAMLGVTSPSEPILVIVE
jgi:hypothetical protein